MNKTIEMKHLLWVLKCLKYFIYLIKITKEIHIGIKDYIYWLLNKSKFRVQLHFSKKKIGACVF